MPRGVIKYFSERRGYGFIECDTDQRIFVHHSEIKGEGYRTLREGQVVRFDVRESKRGLEAVNVHKL
ncbi:MAG: cold shock domain-containing protein [Candidatus Latescibacteria bacterium]|nr:cold shock domain-containing protein [Candidatus Latescibacterota bacterium]NIM21351.1 cold shock domain-containing protein [Candidatus Latescibacterota bacterium]NIM65532.1 cold shock domain-containing protein [Candidatus Latescibacterota bacterium]NIO01912.1 cold shock domain-containing protein [Candidatus Latescibacterota bacterium]NIO28725.1 cold shock domain-containing protein [Candidatus Latescibacterota bacterium]